MIAIKYNEDDIHSNKYYAKVVGISQEDLDRMELSFVKLLGFEMFVKEEEYEHYENYLKKMTEKSECYTTVPTYV